VDSDSHRLGAGVILSGNHVGFAFDSSDLQNLWHIGICNASNDQAALQRSSFGDRLDIPIGTHAWPPIATVPSPDESRLEKVAGVIAPS